MSRRRRRKEVESNGRGWMTTFSDLVTLLLTFFVLLYSFSSIDAAKFRGIAASLQLALTGNISMFDGNGPNMNGPIENLFPDDLPGEGDNSTEDEESVEGIDLMEKEIERIYRLVQGFVEEEGLSADVKLRTDRRGVIIDISDNILFDPGKAELKPDSVQLLDTLTNLITAFENNIIVEGHTDNVPINRSKFATNWELSVHRATSVVHYFIEKKNIAPERLSAAGYGEYRPIAPNDTAENKALNRRVNILIEASLEGGVEGGPTSRD